MSLSLRSLRTARLAVPRSFHTIRPSYAMKESDVSMLPPSRHTQLLANTDQDRDNMDAVYEERKDDQVVSSKEGKARWRDDLASNSEADVCPLTLVGFIGSLTVQTGQGGSGRDRDR